MPTHSKRFKKALAGVNRQKGYSVDDAIDALLATATAKFDETLEIAVRLGVDPRKADQNVRGAIVLPHGTGKGAKVLVLARDAAKEKEAREAGADLVGNDDFLKQIESGWLDFDKLIATPDMMKDLGKLGKVLGPRGLMPSPKTGSVTFDVKRAVEEAKAGKVEFRVDKAGIVHAGIARRSFKKDQVRDNLVALMNQINRMKPSTSKGIYLKTIALSSTMGPGIKVDPAEFRVAA